MSVLQCGFLANDANEPDCSKDICSAIPVAVEQGDQAVKLAKIFPGGWGFSVAATEDGQLYMWGVNAATMLAKGGQFIQFSKRSKCPFPIQVLPAQFYRILFIPSHL